MKEKIKILMVFPILRRNPLILLMLKLNTTMRAKVMVIWEGISMKNTI
jgi:hypothetical protein